MKKLTIKTQVRNVFLNNANAWLHTPDLMAALPNIPKQSIYSTVSALANLNPPELDRSSTTNATGSYQYRLPENLFHLLQQNQEEDAEHAREEEHNKEQDGVGLGVDPTYKIGDEKNQIPLPEIAPAETEQKEVPVQTIEEGKRARQKMWNAEDRNIFTLAYLRARDENPHIRMFQPLADMAQMALPAEKRKHDLKRASIPWFEETSVQLRPQYEEMQRNFEAAKKETRDKEEAQKREEELARQKTNAVQMLGSLGNDILMGELMRRGQSLIETMLINALQSPKVQQTLAATLLANVVAPERRHQDNGRPMFVAPEQNCKPRLERIGIAGVNKPIHQNQMKAHFKDMYDLRFANVDANKSAMQASMGNCAVVIVLTDHIPHRTRAQLVAANIEFTSMSGDKRAVEEFLSKRFLEKDKQ